MGMITSGARRLLKIFQENPRKEFTALELQKIVSTYDSMINSALLILLAGGFIERRGKGKGRGNPYKYYITDKGKRE